MKLPNKFTFIHKNDLGQRYIYTAEYVVASDWYKVNWTFDNREHNSTYNKDTAEDFVRDGWWEIQDNLDDIVEAVPLATYPKSTVTVVQNIEAEPVKLGKMVAEAVREQCSAFKLNGGIVKGKTLNDFLREYVILTGNSVEIVPEGVAVHGDFGCEILTEEKAAKVVPLLIELDKLLNERT